MDWVITVELRIPIRDYKRPLETLDDARKRFKDILELNIEYERITHYHLLSKPRRVDS